MIVEPDFLDHWKTQALIAATGDPAAPQMVIRLWGHCQQRRASKFKNMTAIALAGICRWQRDPEQLLSNLMACGFIDVKNGVLTVHGWEEVNATLVARWRGGENNRRRLLGKPKVSYSLPITSATSDKKGLAGSEKNRIEENRIEKSTPLPPLNGEVVLEIYKAYPKKEGKEEALKAIRKRLVEGKDPKFLLERVETYARAIVVWRERRYIPDPATWFNQGRFDDDETNWHAGPNIAKPKQIDPNQEHFDKFYEDHLKRQAERKKAPL